MARNFGYHIRSIRPFHQKSLPETPLHFVNSRRATETSPLLRNPTRQHLAGHALLTVSFLCLLRAAALAFAMTRTAITSSPGNPVRAPERLNSCHSSLMNVGFQRKEQLGSDTTCWRFAAYCYTDWLPCLSVS